MKKNNNEGELKGWKGAHNSDSWQETICPFSIENGA